MMYRIRVHLSNDEVLDTFETFLEKDEARMATQFDMITDNPVIGVEYKTTTNGVSGITYVFSAHVVRLEWVPA